MRVEQIIFRCPGRRAAFAYVTLLALAIVVLIPGTGESQEVGAVQAVRGGTGNGRIVSEPAGIECTVAPGGVSGTCVASFPEGTRVSLVATPAADSRFVGWAPSRSCPSAGDLEVKGGVVHTCQFVFELTAPLSFLLQTAVTGSGIVTSSPAGIDSRFDSVTGVAAGSSAASFPAGTVVTLTALPLAGWSFAGWSGDPPDCGDGVVTMFEAKLCGATFVPGATGLATAEAVIR